MKWNYSGAALVIMRLWLRAVLPPCLRMRVRMCVCGGGWGGVWWHLNTIYKQWSALMTKINNKQCGTAHMQLPLPRSLSLSLSLWVAHRVASSRVGSLVQRYVALRYVLGPIKCSRHVQNDCVFNFISFRFVSLLVSLLFSSLLVSLAAAAPPDGKGL